MEIKQHQEQPQPPQQHLPQPPRPPYEHHSPYQPPHQHQPRPPHPQPPRSPHKHQPQSQPRPPHQHQPQPPHTHEPQPQQRAPYEHQHHPQPPHHPQQQPHHPQQQPPHLQYQPSHMLYQQPHMPYQTPYQSYQPCQLQKGTNWVSSPSAIRRNCDFCVQKKVKCPGSEDGKGCATCRRKGIKCMYSPKRKPGPKARKRDGEEGAATPANNPGATEGERYYPPSATAAAIPAAAVAPAPATAAAHTPAPTAVPTPEPTAAPAVTFSTATTSVFIAASTAAAPNVDAAPSAAQNPAVIQKKEAKKFKKWMKKMKIKEEMSDTVASSCRGVGGGVSDGGMTSTSTTAFPTEASNFTSNGESTVLSAAAADPSVAGLVGVGCIGSVKRKGKRMKGKKSKGKIKGVTVSSAHAAVQQEVITLKKLSSKKRKSPVSLSWVTGSPAAKANRVSSPRSSNFRLAGWRGALDMNVSDIVDMEIGDDGEPRTAESALGDDPRRMLKANGEAEVVAAPMTIAEQLEAVKAEEAEMLRKFEKTHKRFIKEEARKRAEIEEFRRAGEEALRVMQVMKEGKLRKISDKGKKLRARRLDLVQQRFKEIEAAEKVARAEALERDARLEAERRRLAHCCEDTEQAAPVGGDGSATDGYARLGFFAEETGKAPTAAAASVANGANGVAPEHCSSSVLGERGSYDDDKQEVEETGGK